MPISRLSATSSLNITVPAGSQNALPGATSENVNSPSCGPSAPVVARLRLLEALEVLGEVVLREERGAVDAGEHLAARVPAPVRPGDGLQLERLDALRAGPVRPAAEVGEGPVGVEADGLQRMLGIGVRDEILDQLDLVVLPLRAEALERLVDRHVLAHEPLVGLHVLAHLLLDAREVRVGDRHALGKLEVVVEAVLDRRPDRDLHARIELHHRRRQHVRGVMADDVERAVARRRDDLQRLPGHERTRKIAHLAVLAHRERGPRQPRTDRRGGIRAGRAVVELELGSVWKGDVHGPIVTSRARFSSSRPPRQGRAPAGSSPPPTARPPRQGVRRAAVARPAPARAAFAGRARRRPPGVPGAPRRTPAPPGRRATSCRPRGSAAARPGRSQVGARPRAGKQSLAGGVASLPSRRCSSGVRRTPPAATNDRPVRRAPVACRLRWPMKDSSTCVSEPWAPSALHALPRRPLRQWPQNPQHPHPRRLRRSRRPAARHRRSQHRSHPSRRLCPPRHATARRRSRTGSSTATSRSSSAT